MRGRHIDFYSSDIGTDLAEDLALESGEHEETGIQESDLPEWPLGFIGGNLAACRRGPGLAVSDVAPTIGSDSSSEDERHHRSFHAQGGGDAGAREGTEVEENVFAVTDEDEDAALKLLERRLLECDKEERELKALYDAEVVRCADLRDELEDLDRQEAEASERARRSAEAELLAAHEELDEVRRNECRSAMIAEDDLGRCQRLLDGRTRELQFLDHRLQELQRKRQALANEGSDSLSPEETLRRADSELCELQLEVERNAGIAAQLDADLRNVLEFMMRTNIDAAGGPSPEFGLEDFLPSCVRSHLALSKYGESHIEAVAELFEGVMAESTVELDHEDTACVEQIFSGAEPHGLSAAACDTALLGEATAMAMTDGAMADEHGQMAEAMDFEEAVEEPQPPLSPLVAAELFHEPPGFHLEDHDIEFAEGYERRPTDAQPPHFFVSADFDEERKVLQESLEQELRALSGTLNAYIARAEAVTATSLRASSSMENAHVANDIAELAELLRSAARGDLESVKVLFPRVRTMWNHGQLEEDRLLTETGDTHAVALGWTSWHAAALKGHCDVLDYLKEEAFLQGEHYLEALERRTASMGLSPLGVACLSGHIEAVSSLLQGLAPVDCVDARGNSPLHLAHASECGEVLLPRLLQARADPHALNWSGQRLEVQHLLYREKSSYIQSSSALARAIAVEEHVSPLPQHVRGEDWEKLPVEGYRCIRAHGASGTQDKRASSLLSRTLGVLKAPIRDNTGFMKNKRVFSQARLSGDEMDAGVWSDRITNYTHAGLATAFDVNTPHGAATIDSSAEQVLVLTVERLLLLHARDWSLTQVIALSDIAELIISTCSTSIFILRMHRIPDLLLDVDPATRPRLLDELQLATKKVALAWGGQDFGGCGAQVLSESDPIVALLDERRSRVATIAFTESNVFLLCPYSPTSVLLSGGSPVHFGFLDLHRSIGDRWSWVQMLFVLRGGLGEDRLLLWCRHPCDEACAGAIPVQKIVQVQPLDTPHGEVCMIIDFQDDVLTLRASTATSRKEWIEALRSVRPSLQQAPP